MNFFDPIQENLSLQSRRQLLQRTGVGIGGAALSSLLHGGGATATAGDEESGLHHIAKAKRVIYLFQSGGPSQMDLWDYKPDLVARRGVDLPDSIRMGQRLTGMTARQNSLPIAPSIFNFSQHGESGTWVSELLPHTAKMVDDLCLVKTVTTNAINHDPGITFLQTGHELPGRPSMGAWMHYGLGSMNEDLPAFVVLLSAGNYGAAQPVYSRLWGSGFLPTSHQGVQMRAAGDPVLYLRDPAFGDPARKRKLLDTVSSLNALQYEKSGDSEIQTRISQYEMAYRMQTSVPELTDLSEEPESTFERYGPDSRKPGSFAANCLLARRLAERDVRFIQLYHTGWDHHGGLPAGMRTLCGETDQPCAALIQDLKDRGMFEDTLVIWGGEFGRTIYSQGKLTETNYGRDHHPRSFTMWMAGGGVKGGVTHGETDEFSYNVARDPVHVHDMQATIMHLMGIDHERLTYKFQGRRFRLTDIHGHVVKDLLT
ncbi:MAG: DUF1501 domain-containing protein [Verrucomicrobiales bacterium]|nr:DUF1501 domain-containing protein [Verrucomicrobiales bacterium]